MVADLNLRPLQRRCPNLRISASPGGIFTFTATWSEFLPALMEFLLALTFHSEDGYRTVPVGIALFAGRCTVPYGTLSAGPWRPPCPSPSWS
ncbi:hypothetical protein [Streptomyces sp. NPDC048196]|uniref:hypothetical protein n=1 Tax=Streptomyces sp. NPDC048196 TaxID=3154712 RepID=UPI0033D25D04